MKVIDGEELDRKSIEDYQKIEDGTVGAYKKIEKGFVDTFLDGKHPDQK